MQFNLKMALFKHLLLKKQPNYVMPFFRSCTGAIRTGFGKSFSTHFTLLSQTEIPGSAFQSARKTQFANNLVSTISNQVKDCLKGKVSQEYVLNNFSRYKRNKELSDGDAVRILFRLAKTQHPFWKSNEEAVAKFYKVLMDDIINNRDQLKPFQIADVLWSLGKLGSIDSDLFDKFGRLIQSIKDFSDFSNGDLAMILWAHAKANISAPVVFIIIQKVILERGFESFTTKEICQIVWSFARASTRTAKLFASARETIQGRDITEFNNHDIIMLLWAYSEKGINVKPFFRFFKMELLNGIRLAQCSGKDLSMILWSFANQGIKAQDLFASIEKELLTKSSIELDDQSLVVIAWSFAQTENKSPRLYKFIEAKMKEKKLSKWPLNRLVRIMWAFTKSGFLSGKALNNITTAMVDKDFSKLSQTEIEEMVFIFQYCKRKISPKLVSLVELELMRRAGEPTTDD